MLRGPRRSYMRFDIQLWHAKPELLHSDAARPYAVWSGVVTQLLHYQTRRRLPIGPAADLKVEAGGLVQLW